jgi:ABC-type iron transport system FetAB permease component
MKTTIERFVLGLLLAPVAPLAGLMAFWFLGYIFLPEKWIPYSVLTGVLLGVLVDFLVLKPLLDRAHQLSPAFWMTVLLFYSVGMFGMFMGVPIFNAALSIPTGFVVGGRLAHEMANEERIRTASFRACLLTTSLLALICAASAFFALSSSSTPSDLEGMLRLGFTVTPGMIWGIILAGGVGLLAINWFLTGIAVRLTARYLRAA